jgi:hypothetical protein
MGFLAAAEAALGVGRGSRFYISSVSPSSAARAMGMGLPASTVSSAQGVIERSAPN